ncbi:MAG: TlyA family rRNA (cytidine-2'-O)-methyltransferase, partial [Clostridia bacterium]|nr:TlyA family rRNA (cytidine-2'-O)-methyltransferase [Clostridia bacterium]
EVGEKGVVRDRAVHERVVTSILDFVPTLGWRIAGLDFSPIRGPEGNIEFLLDMIGPENTSVQPRECSVTEVIDAAYDKFFKSNSKGL